METLGAEKADNEDNLKAHKMETRNDRQEEAEREREKKRERERERERVRERDRQTDRLQFCLLTRQSIIDLLPLVFIVYEQLPSVKLIP